MIPLLCSMLTSPISAALTAFIAFSNLFFPNLSLQLLIFCFVLKQRSPPNVLPHSNLLTQTFTGNFPIS